MDIIFTNSKGTKCSLSKILLKIIYILLKVFLHLLAMCMYVFLYAGTHVPFQECGGQRPPCRNQFSFSTMWVLGMELGSSTLVKRTFTCVAILLMQITYSYA